MFYRKENFQGYYASVKKSEPLREEEGLEQEKLWKMYVMKHASDSTEKVQKAEFSRERV